MMRLIVIMLISTLCVSCNSEKVTWYVLTSNKPMQHRTQTKPAKVVLGMDKITVPVYLRNDKITTRVNNNTLEEAEFHRWAEPVADNIKRVLAVNIHNQIQHVDVIHQPWAFDTKVSERLKIAVLRFDTDENSTSHLVVTWSIYNADESKLLFRQTKSYQHSFEGTEYTYIVAAMSKNVNMFSQDVIRSLRRTLSS